ncbi:MAG: hypothetical protein KF745_07000 [Phycisphaeraceae bacterium]|nr:hypothetical protein [Phycisphaeraceae bacterium]
MKRTILSLAVISAAAIGLGMGEPDKQANKAPTRLDSMKKLAGTWETDDADKDGKPDGVCVFRVSSAGSAIVETMFPGTNHEMTNMYVMDGPDMLVTHYCAGGNQPRMKCAEQKDPKVFAFTFMDGTNLDPAKGNYMGGLTITMVDDDTITEEWTSFQNGKESPDKTIFHLKRSKANAGAGTK